MPDIQIQERHTCEKKSIVRPSKNIEEAKLKVNTKSFSMCIFEKLHNIGNIPHQSAHYQIKNSN